MKSPKPLDAINSAIDFAKQLADWGMKHNQPLMSRRLTRAVARTVIAAEDLRAALVEVRSTYLEESGQELPS